MTGNAYGDGGILRFQTNVPAEVALPLAEGLPVEGRFGDQMLHTPLDAAQGRRPRKALGDFDLSICQPRQRGKCVHVPSLPSDYFPVPRDPAAAGEEV